MAHVFLSLDQIGQAQQVAAATAAALEPRAKATNAAPEAQSLYGACQLVLAITAARDNDRTAAYRHLDLARDIDYKALSAERRARHMIDLASAHAMRRQVGEAIHDLQQAEKITPELIHGHHGARVVTRELLQLSGLRPRPELGDLAEQFGVLP